MKSNHPCASAATAIAVAFGGFFTCVQAQEAGEKPISPDKIIRFFQGDKTKEIYTWLSRSQYKDPDNVLSIKDGVVHFTGDESGYLCTEMLYRDYQLLVEYRWGEQTYGSRKTMARSSGVFLHGNGPDGGSRGQYMTGLECQIIEGGTGDFELIPPRDLNGNRDSTSQRVSITVETAKHLDYAKQPVWEKGGKRITLADVECLHARRGTRVSWFNHDSDWRNEKGYKPKNDLASPGKEWTRLKIISAGDHVQFYVNGILASEAFDVKPSSGKISLQLEGAEIYFRNFELHPLPQ
jgi:hypothetical protein